MQRTPGVLAMLLSVASLWSAATSRLQEAPAVPVQLLQTLITREHNAVCNLHP